MLLRLVALAVLLALPLAPSAAPAFAQAPLAGAGQAASPVILSVNPSSAAFLGAICALATGLYVFFRGIDLPDERQRRFLLVSALGAIVLSLVLLLLAASLPLDGASVAFLPLEPAGAGILKAGLCVAILIVTLASLYGASPQIFARHPRAQAPALALLALVGFSGFYNWGAGGFPGLLDYRDLSRSYLAAKYSREIPARRLPECLAKAFSAVEPSLAPVGSLIVRSSSSGEAVPATTVIGAIDSCPSAFAPERWQEFLRDSSFFFRKLDNGSWFSALQDPARTASIAWFAVASPIAALIPASEWGMRLLALLDPFLMILALSLAGRTFGLRAACLAACFFGIFPVNAFEQLGGSFLRLGWLAASVLGVTLLSRGAYLLAGLLIGYAGLMAAAPLWLLALPAAWSVVSYARTAEFSRPARKLLCGAAAAVLVAYPLGSMHADAPLVLPLDPGSGDPRPAFGLPSLASALLSAPSESRAPSRTAPRQPRRSPLSQILSPSAPTPEPLFSSIEATAPPVPPPAQLAAQAPLQQRTLGGWPWILVGLAVALVAAVALAGEQRLWVLAILGCAVLPFGPVAPSESLSLLLVVSFLHREDPRLPLFLFLFALAVQGLSAATGSVDLQQATCSLVLLYFSLEAILTYRQAMQARVHES